MTDEITKEKLLEVLDILDNINAKLEWLTLEHEKAQWLKDIGVLE